MFYFYAMLALQWNIKTLESCIFCISYSNCELFLFYGFFCRNRSKLLEITLNTVLFCFSWWKIGGFFWRIYKVSNCATFINNSFSPVIIIWSNILQTADSDDDITHFYLETPRNRVDCGLISNVPIWITFEFFEFIQTNYATVLGIYGLLTNLLKFCGKKSNYENPIKRR